MMGEAQAAERGPAVGTVVLSLSELLRANTRVPSASSAEFALRKLNGTLSVHVDRGADQVELRYDLSLRSPDSLLKELRELQLSFENKCISSMTPSATERHSKKSDSSAGNATDTVELMFSVRDMSCSNCATKVEKTLLKMSGVASASVSSMTNKAKVVVRPPPSSSSSVSATSAGDLEEGGERQSLEEIAAQIEAKVTSIGYRCEWIRPQNMRAHHPAKEKKEVEKEKEDEAAEELVGWRRLLVLSLLLGVPVLVLHLVMAAMSSGWNPFKRTAGMSPAAMDEGMSPDNVFMKPVPFLCHGKGITLAQTLMVALNVPLLIFVGFR